MDIDDTVGSSLNASREKSAKLHPLAIVGISDHYTRVKETGLDSSNCAMGLLFGEENVNDDQLHISIIDSEEVEPIHNTTLEPEQSVRIRTKIELHQKVFPQHRVVGWYRVVDEQSADYQSDEDYALPSQEDLKTQSGWMKEFSSNPIFLLMNASNRKDRNAAFMLQSQGDDDQAKNAMARLDREEELPLSIYESITTENEGTVFLNLELEIETFEPERIAVERVLKSHKPDFQNINWQGKGMSTETGDMKESGESDVEMSTVEVEQTSDLCPSTAAEIYLRSAITSIDAMNTRTTILLDFLEKTHSKQIPINHDLLRQVNSLVKQMPFVMAYNTGNNSSNNDNIKGDDFDQNYDTLLVMSYLATITKTTNAVLQYSKKVGTLLKK